MLVANTPSPALGILDGCIVRSAGTGMLVYLRDASSSPEAGSSISIGPRTGQSPLCSSLQSSQTVERID